MSEFHFTIQRNQPAQFDRWPARAPHWIIYAENGLPVKDVHDVTTGQALEQLQATVMEQSQEIGRLRAQKDGAYSERDRLVCALSKIFPSWLERHPLTDTSWDDDWRWIVFINFPTGQGSWHIHKSEHPWFEHLDVKSSNSWDGHTNDQKYDRVAALQPKEGGE